MAIETPWLTVAEAAAYVKYSPRSIRSACRDGVLRHAQTGGAYGKILTRREWLDAWVQKHVQGGTQ